jgi:hypothetical protein
VEALGIILVSTGGFALLLLAEGGWVLKHMAYPVGRGERGEDQVRQKKLGARASTVGCATRGGLHCC